MLARLSGTVCLKHSATLILPPLSKPPSRRTCLIIISKLFFYSPAHPLVRRCVCVCVCARVCVVSVIVKRPVLPLCVVDGRSRNPLYYYYYYYWIPPLSILGGCLKAVALRWGKHLHPPPPPIVGSNFLCYYNIVYFN